ncbi:MAG: DUF3240 family protein [Nevskia sp.]|uniref:DUF3240 family protein n=1 Tax=Nevskia sp. TaxID=1929292 RepID=UPI0040369C08
MNADVMLLLIAEPDSAERLADLLAGLGLAEGWYQTPVELAGGTAPYRNRREQVRGRRQRLRFELFASRADAARIAAEVDRCFAAHPALAAPLRRILLLAGE